MSPRILVADDEAAVREQLVESLARVWPDACVVAECEHGAEAWDQWLAQEPDAAFLDIRMPGLSGIEVAQRIQGRCPVVFVTAFGDHALQAFDSGAVDYVVKPVDPDRLARAVARVQQQLGQPRGPDDALAALLARLVPRRPPQPRHLQASVGREVRLIPLVEVLYFESDSRYTRVVFQAGHGQQEALLRTPLKDLLAVLDPSQFTQIHRSVVVATAAMASAVRDDDGGMRLRLRGSPDLLPVSRPFQGLFKGQ
jgi:DNA-binding LytR/AlgR family response regulator